MLSARAIGDHRSEVRLEVEIAVAIKPYRSPPQHLVMADVSTAGALIHGDFRDLFKGQEVILMIGHALCLVATIAWVGEDRLGLAFHKRISGFDFDSVLKLDTSDKTRRRKLRRESSKLLRLSESGSAGLPTSAR